MVHLQAIEKLKKSYSSNFIKRIPQIMIQIRKNLKTTSTNKTMLITYNKCKGNLKKFFSTSQLNALHQYLNHK